jgi:hypothetical protein
LDYLQPVAWVVAYRSQSCGQIPAQDIGADGFRAEAHIGHISDISDISDRRRAQVVFAGVITNVEQTLLLDDRVRHEPRLLPIIGMDENSDHFKLSIVRISPSVKTRRYVMGAVFAETAAL